MNSLEKNASSGFVLDEHNSAIVENVKPVFIVNQNNHLVLRRWTYTNGSWQNMNCPVGQTCASADISVCHQNPNTEVQIGTMPCGVVVTIYAIFFDTRENREKQFRIENTSVDCGAYGKYVHLGPQH